MIGGAPPLQLAMSCTAVPDGRGEPLEDTGLALTTHPEGGGGTAAMGLAALDPGVVGSLVTFLASDEAANVNGRDFMIRGGEVGLYTVPTVEARAFSPDRYATAWSSSLRRGGRLDRLDPLLLLADTGGRRHR